MSSSSNIDPMRSCYGAGCYCQIHVVYSFNCPSMKMVYSMEYMPGNWREGKEEKEKEERAR